MESLNPIVLKKGAAPPTPAAGTVVLYSVDGSALLLKDESGSVVSAAGGTKVSALTPVTAPSDSDSLPIVSGGATGKISLIRTRGTALNASTVSQGAGFATDTYLAGSNVTIPDGGLRAKTLYRCVFHMSKTAAGTATPIVSIRLGTNGTTADTARSVLTFAAQTAAADDARFDIWAVFRSIGSGTSAVLQGFGTISHRLASTGFSTAATSVAATTSSGFDSTGTGLVIGLSVNGGTSAAWTTQFARAELENLA